MNLAALILQRSSSAELCHIGPQNLRARRCHDDLSANVARLGDTLIELGVRAKDRVFISSASRVEALETILACFDIGAVAVPVSPLLGIAQMKHIVTTMHPKCCFFEDFPDPIVEESLRQEGAIRVTFKSAARSAASDWTAYSALVTRRDARESQRSPRNSSAQETALIIHGSGSTGALKAISFTHEGLATYLEYNSLIFSQFTINALTVPATAALTSIPLHHLAGLGNTLLALMNGQPTYLAAFNPANFLDLVRELQLPHILLVPSLYRSVLKEQRKRSVPLPSLRFCIIGGEPCPAELLSEITSTFSVPTVTAYGLTECLAGIAHLRRDLFSRNSVKAGSCGKQLFGEVSLRDEDGNRQDRYGELWVRNATVRDCYMDPALNEQKIVDGWLKTGDLFLRDEDGDYFHRGRVDDMFISNGKNVYPTEVEQLLCGHPAVEAACAAPVSLSNGTIVPAALVVLSTQVLESDLQQYCMKYGASHVVPQILVFSEQIPTLGPGKVDRRTVKEILQKRSQS